MLLPVIFIVVTLSVSTIGAKVKSDEVERGNNYVDKLIEDIVTTHGDEYDPYPMEDSRVGFNRKVVFVNVSGEAKLFNGQISGLRTLHRAEDSKLTEKDGRLYVKADLGVGVVNLHYDGTVKFMNLGPTITVHGSVNYIEIIMEFSVDAKTGKDGKLHKFTIDDLRGMKAWITGLGPLKWAINPILSGVTKIFKRLVRRVLENKIENHIKEKLPNHQFPVEGIDEVTSGTDSSIGEEITETVNPKTTTEEPVTEEETEEPVTEEETEEPEEETEEPLITEEETEEPVTEEETEEPEEETEEPLVTEEETEEPVTEEETEEPEEETEEPEEVTEEPVIEEETEEPVIEEETEEPVIEEETEEPVIEEETEEPVVEEETEEPVIEEETEEPIVEEETEPTEEEPVPTIDEIVPDEEEETGVDIENENVLW